MAVIAEHRGETSIYISLEDSSDGSICLSGQDIGKAPKETFGKDDYEYWLTIPPAQQIALLEALLKERYSGRLDAVSDLAGLCKRHGVVYQFHSH